MLLNYPCCSTLSLAGQFFRDGVKVDVDTQLLHVPGHPPVPVEKRNLWKFMSKSLVATRLFDMNFHKPLAARVSRRPALRDEQCWTLAYPSSQGAGIVAGTYEDYIVDGLLAVIKN